MAQQTGTISYPVDLMRQVAGQIMVDAGQAMIDHQNQWNDVQTYLSSLPGMVQSHVQTLLNQHQQRLMDSYQWQLDFANALMEAAQYMDDLDHGIRDTFDPQTGTITNPQAPPEIRPAHGPF